jgi:hypothetical protein
MSLRVMEISRSVCLVMAWPSRYRNAHTVELSTRIQQKEQCHARQNACDD